MEQTADKHDRALQIESTFVRMCIIALFHALYTAHQVHTLSSYI
jgi:hypothetical protein